MTNINHSDYPDRVVVVGASAGGTDALRALLQKLEPAFPAPLLIVQHLSFDAPGLLPSILERASPLPVVAAGDGAPLRAGEVVVAPPDRHLLVQDGHGQGTRLRLTHGARQNRSRPAIDVLFRSAAVAFRSRTVGVLLTGMLDDGVEGLAAVRRCGGVTVVQDPQEASYPEMVEAALATMAVDYRLEIAGIAALLNRLAHEPPGENGQAPEDLQLEVAIDLDGHSDPEQLARLSQASTLSCPDCGGRLWQSTTTDAAYYRCEVGHTYSRQALLDSMDENVERSLWTALRTLEERLRMLERLAGEEEAEGGGGASFGFRERAAEVRQDAQTLRNFLLRRAR